MKRWERWLLYVNSFVSLAVLLGVGSLFVGLNHTVFSNDDRLGGFDTDAPAKSMTHVPDGEVSSAPEASWSYRPRPHPGDIGKVNSEMGLVPDLHERIEKNTPESVEQNREKAPLEPARPGRGAGTPGDTEPSRMP